MSDTPRTDDIVMQAVAQGMRLAPVAELARELERENANLREDKERLDWLTNTSCWLTFPGLSRHQNWRQGTARDVIDLARKEAQP